MLHKDEELMDEFKFELQSMDDAIKKNSCESNSWLTCLRALASIYIGEVASMSTYLVMHRVLHGLSQETELLLLLSSIIPGVMSGCLIWWSTREVANCLDTRSNQIKLDNLLEKINQIKQEKLDQADELIGHPVSKAQQSEIWSFFKSYCPRQAGYQLLSSGDDLEIGLRSKNTF